MIFSREVWQFQCCYDKHELFLFLVEDFSFTMKNNGFFGFSGQGFQFYCEKQWFFWFFWFSGLLFEDNGEPLPKVVQKTKKKQKNHYFLL